jgi:hypothetical protein
MLLWRVISPLTFAKIMSTLDKLSLVLKDERESGGGGGVIERERAYNEYSYNRQLRKIKIRYARLNYWEGNRERIKEFISKIRQSTVADSVFTGVGLLTPSLSCPFGHPLAWSIESRDQRGRGGKLCKGYDDWLCRATSTCG